MKTKEQIGLQGKTKNKKQAIKSLAKSEKGITLIALVVTIIVLLILAGITITMVLGEDGILAQAKLAATRVKGAQDNEQEDLENLLNELDGILVNEENPGGNTNTPGTNPGGNTDTPKTDIPKPNNRYPDGVEEDEQGKSVVVPVVVPAKENNKFTIYTVGYIPEWSAKNGIKGSTFTINLSNTKIDFTKYSLKVENQAVMSTLEDFENYREQKEKGNMWMEGSNSDKDSIATAEELYDHRLTDKELTINSIKVSYEGDICKVTIDEGFQNLSEVPESRYHNAKTKDGTELKVLYNGKKFELVPTEKTVVAKEDSYVGYYADTDGDNEADGVIYADLAQGKSGQWGDDFGSYTIPTVSASELKEYKITQESYTGKFGTKPVLARVNPNDDTKEDRFYVMALKDVEGQNKNGLSTTSFCWWYAAYFKGISNYNTLTSMDFGAGYKNTETMIQKWNDSEYGKQNDNAEYKDLWGVVQGKFSEGWFVPSAGEWSAFGQTLDITSANYGNKFKLSDNYWSSSLFDEYIAFEACRGETGGDNIDNAYCMRLSTTF